MNHVEAIINILCKGFLVGAVVSAPMGPVGIMCIQRTLSKGRWYGFVTGIGASISDLMYAILTGFGLNLIFPYINNHIYYLQLIGSFMLFIFGIYTFFVDPTKNNENHHSNQKTGKGTYLYNLVTAFLVTLSNPLIVFLFIGLFNSFSFTGQGVLLTETIPFYAAIVTGALCWWLGITSFINKVRNKFERRGILILNRSIGAIVIAVSFLVFYMSITEQSIYTN